MTQPQEQPTGNLSPPSPSADNNSSATAQQVVLPQGVTEGTAQQLSGLVGVAEDDAAQQSNLAQSISNHNLEDLDRLGNLSQSLTEEEVSKLADVFDGVNHGNQVALLDLAELLGPEEFAALLKSDELTKLFDELDEKGKAELLDRLNNNFVGDEEELDEVLDKLGALLNLRGFFDLGDLDKDELEDLFDFFGIFDLDELDDDEREDLLRLLRFFDLDDLDDLLDRIDRFDRDFDIDDIESGDVNPSIDIRNTGDNANLCLGISQVANSGNVANQQGVSQYGAGADEDFDDGRFFVSDDDRRFGFLDDDLRGFDFGDRDGDIEFEGSSIEIDSDVDVDCQQAIIQTAAAGAAPSLVRPAAVAPVTPVSVAAAAAPRAAVTAAAGVGGAPAAVGLVARPPAQLPPTGGLPLSLVVLGLAGVGAGLALLRYRHQR